MIFFMPTYSLLGTAVTGAAAAATTAGTGAAAAATTAGTGAAAAATTAGTGAAVAATTAGTGAAVAATTAAGEPKHGTPGAVVVEMVMTSTPLLTVWASSFIARSSLPTTKSASRTC